MATEKEEKGKIQLVTPLAIQKRWEELQDSPKYRDQAKYKLLEDMITSMEIATFGIDHPEYASQLEDLDKFWSAIRNFLTRLISDTEKADENARKRLENTLRKLEADVAKIPQIEESRRDYFSKYFDASKRIEELSKSLEEAKKRTDEAEARRVLRELPVTTLFVDGNHENFEQLNSYGVDIWNGGKVHFVESKIIHLMRGQVFDIDGTRFFTFGGAHSIDKNLRAEGITWFPEEIPTRELLKYSRTRYRIALDPY